MNHLSYVKRGKIDEQKWNALITDSANSLPYGFSWYLDAICTWDALVLNDYEAVMPLPWLRKFGFKALYQPYYCQQLGFFSKKELSPAVMVDFIERAMKEFSYLNINLNPIAS
ncbi:MAG: family N-acetyltransferase, partial [Bacteroidota bacterium]|nr:family N-acetyltransferase [Bacteroidota bacterium]